MAGAAGDGVAPLSPLAEQLFGEVTEMQGIIDEKNEYIRKLQWALRRQTDENAAKSERITALVDEKEEERAERSRLMGLVNELTTVNNGLYNAVQELEEELDDSKKKWFRWVPKMPSLPSLKSFFK